MRDSILRTRTYAFALLVIRTYKQMVAENREYVLSKQFLKSGTAIGALVREAEFAQSKPDFISKMSIALKEANECEYWVSLLKDSKFLDEELASEINTENKELISMLVATIKTLKKVKN